MTKLVDVDREVLRTWQEHGIPLDPSTVDHASRLLGKLVADLEEAWRLVFTLLDGRPPICEVCRGETQPSLPIDDVA